ncbi:MAG: ArnT family glycosyltransferase [Minisyncoccales bacterium]
MVEIGFLLGIFSYIVFGLGLLGKLEWLRGVGTLGGLGIFLVLIYLIWKKRNKFLGELEILKEDKINIFLIGILLISALVNFIGVLGPELGFDALWYHLTIPKIYLQWKKIFFLPGSLFYYSSMPKLTEMFYLVSLAFSPNGTLAKTIHFSFGLLSAIALYRLSRRYLKTKESLLTVLIFYTTLVVGWQSITAYVDLARTFFEILALDLFLQWYEKNQKDQRDKMLLIESAIMLGLAISTKLIAFASLAVFLILILLNTKKIKFALYYLLFAVLVPLPWFVFAFIHTGNPIYPIFSGILDQSHQIMTFNLIRVVRDFWKLFYHPQDFISPVFLIFLPIVILKIVKGELKGKIQLLWEYVLLTLFFWYFTPRTGGSRFVLPYLPALSLLIVGVVSEAGKFFQKLLILTAIASAVVNVGYRAFANKKFIPVILGRESRDVFLSKKLNFQNGDFFDVNGDLQKIIRKDDLVLVCGFHNLFYADFSFVEITYAPDHLPVSYILVKKEQCSGKIALGSLVYRNNQTGVELYLAPPR